jgi:FAD synthetase
MVFGVFDLLHPGHLFFLREAKRHARYLTVVVARDRAVLKLKNRSPRWSEGKRLRALRGVPGVDRVLLGDLRQGAYSHLRKLRPLVLCLGYDQRGLARDLRLRMRTGKLPRTKLVHIKAHAPHRFKSSLMWKLHKNL